MQDALPADRVLFGETGVSEPHYWDDRHKDYPFKKIHQRYKLDPETLRPYQDPVYDEPTAVAKDRWAFDGQFWLVEETLVPTSRYSLFKWRDDPTFATDVARENYQDFVRLVDLLEARPRVLADEDVEHFLNPPPPTLD